MKLIEILSGPEKFCTGAFAKTASSAGVLWDHPEAVQFCLRGAAFKAAEMPGNKRMTFQLCDIDLKLNAIIEKLTGQKHYCPAGFANVRTYEEILPIIKAYDTYHEVNRSTEQS